MQTDNIFSFDDIAQKMIPIKQFLSIKNAIKLEFDTTQIATADGTHLIKINGKNATEIHIAPENNIYFLFDQEFLCRYVGKKGNNEGINYRLNLHLVKNSTYKNKSQTFSCIEEVCKHINQKNDTLYLITACITPSFMVEGVESYFIDYFREKGEADWVKRK